MGLLSKLFGNKNESITNFINRNAVIIDVRTVAEYRQGAISGSQNIPLQDLNSKLTKIKNYNKPVITCCASGMRSGNAASILKKNGIESLNGGVWSSLQNKL